MGKGGGGSSSKSGYSALSRDLQGAFNPLGMAIGQYTNPANTGVNEMFTPMAQTGDETNAINQFRQGFTPTQQSLTNDISMQMNPFNSFVIDEINRQGQGQNSVLQQQLSNSGQFGSNRSILGANDIDLSRMNQIGGLLQGQYNTAMGNAMNVLPGLRQQDAQNMFNIGGFQRGLDTQTRQAPINALTAGTGLMAPFISGVSSKGGGSTIGDTLGGLGGLAMGVGSLMASDLRLKQDIEKIGNENGFNVYKFKYVGGDKEFIGVMAQEVEQIMPRAVQEDDDGFKRVDYDMIGVKFREYSH